MSTNEELTQSIQKHLQLSGIPGWLFYGFHDVDPIALKILRFGPDPHISRRWFYLVPAEGEPRKLVHRIEPTQLDHLPGTKALYHRWDLMQTGLENLLAGVPEVAMQYSENNAIPYISRVDAGIVEWVRSLGVNVISSGDLIQLFEAVLSEKRKDQHRRAATSLTEIIEKAFRWAGEEIGKKGETDEYTVQAFILDEFSKAELVTDHLPIVGVNRNSADPHYAPTKESSQPIREGDFLLLDIFGRVAGDPGSIYADITWTGFYGDHPGQHILEVFDVVRRSRDAGIDLLRNRMQTGTPTEGWEIDDAVREIIVSAGYGDYFVHRTGHNLGQDVHGNGVCFDNLETHDTRKIIPGILNTIEPGVYLDQFGVRNEIDILILEDDVEVTTPPQNELLLLK